MLFFAWLPLNFPWVHRHGRKRNQYNFRELFFISIHTTSESCFSFQSTQVAGRGSSRGQSSLLPNPSMWPRNLLWTKIHMRNFQSVSTFRTLPHDNTLYAIETDDSLMYAGFHKQWAGQQALLDLGTHGDLQYCTSASDSDRTVGLYWWGSHSRLQYIVVVIGFRMHQHAHWLEDSTHLVVWWFSLLQMHHHHQPLGQLRYHRHL